MTEDIDFTPGFRFKIGDLVFPEAALEVRGFAPPDTVYQVEALLAEVCHGGQQRFYFVGAFDARGGMSAQSVRIPEHAVISWEEAVDRVQDADRDRVDRWAARMAAREQLRKTLAGDPPATGHGSE